MTRYNAIEIERKWQDRWQDAGCFHADIDPSKPKLIKGPDIFIEIIKELSKKNKNLKVVLSGKRRDYVIQKLEDLNVDFRYFEMASTKIINDLIHKTVKKLGVSAITITHDISSINNLASRVILLDNNKIAWSGKPNEMNRSKNSIVMQFLINK